MDGQAALLDILDTAGQEEFSSMQDQWMRDGQGFLLVYNITSSPTFDEVAVLYEKILRTKEGEESGSIPIVLAGNKCDLEDERTVSQKEGEERAASMNAPFFETSAKAKINVDTVFFELVRKIRAKQSVAGAPVTRRKKLCAIL